jgi:1,4-alpha-glucan branching enzyme
MNSAGQGWHELVSPESNAGTLYKFLLEDGLQGPDPACDAGIEKVSLQHGVVLRYDRDDYRGVFRA